MQGEPDARARPRLQARTAASMKTKSPTPPAARKGIARAQRSSPPGDLALKKILVPVDFSQPSREAVVFARGLARKFRARLVLLHVFLLPSDEYTPMLADAYLKARQEGHDEARRLLRQLAAELALPAALKTEFLVKDGVAHRSINVVAEQQGVDLIVIGTHGLTGLRRLISLGSTAERVARHAPCPVVVVHGKST